MTNLFKYDFAPTRAPPIGLPHLNLPGSFNSIAFDAVSAIQSAPWLDFLIYGFAIYGGMILIPKMFKIGQSWVRKFT